MATQRFTVPLTSVYGNHVPYDRGNMVKSPDIEAGLDGHADTWNAEIIAPTFDDLKLWVYEMEVSFELGGTNAQSRRMRQFFPHNFSQVAMTVRGTAPNNFQYNRLASFVRMSQSWAVFGDDVARQLNVLGAPNPNRHSADGSAVLTSRFMLRHNNADIKPSDLTKGPHRPWIVEGYVKNIKAGASRFEFAKDYEFDFEIAFSKYTGTVGIFHDSAVVGYKILPWMDIFKKYQFEGINGSQPASSAPMNLLQELVNFVGDIG